MLRHNFYYIFFFLTIVLISFGIFFPIWLFFIVSGLFTLMFGLVYDSFNKKGYTIHFGFICIHFILTCLFIYISYFSLRQLLEIFLQVLRREAINLQMLHYLKTPLIIIGILLLSIILVFSIGLYKSRKN